MTNPALSIPDIENVDELQVILDAAFTLLGN
jgi:hypothetical protein